MGTNTNINMTSTECTTSELLCEICELSSGVIEVFNDLLKKYLMVMFGQFRKDIKCHMHIEKTMAHRKQIKVKSLKRDKKTNEKTTTQNETNTVEATCSTSSTSDNERPLVIEENVILCKKCKSDNNRDEWIQCDQCDSWWHRQCAGLGHHMKWKKFSKGNAKWYCEHCENK